MVAGKRRGAAARDEPRKNRAGTEPRANITDQAARHRARAIRRMHHHRGCADYKELRAQTVEQVFGQIKTCQKLTTMSRRGLDASRSEAAAATAHNLRKLHIHRLSA